MVGCAAAAPVDVGSRRAWRNGDEALLCGRLCACAGARRRAARKEVNAVPRFARSQNYMRPFDRPNGCQPQWSMKWHAMMIMSMTKRAASGCLHQIERASCRDRVCQYV